jgi:nucleoside-diphosphate-sugar epimerase
LSAARDLGIVVASLAVEGTLAGLPAETLVEQGIRAVWSLAADESVRKPLMLRPNLWNLPVTRRMPIIKGWRMKTGDGVREALRRASAQQGVVHLAVDARAMAGGANFTALAGTFKSIAAAREEGEIRLATLASAAAELSQTRHSTPLRSILRAA